jgi:hypothetical protein
MKNAIYVYCVPIPLFKESPTGYFFVLNPLTTGFYFNPLAHGSVLTLFHLEVFSDVLPAAHALHHTGAGQTAGLCTA